MFAGVNTNPSSSPFEIQTAGMIVRGILAIPQGARSIVVFAHGIDSSSRSPRNHLVARSLLQRGFAVALPDLSTEFEDDSLPAPQNDQEDIVRTAHRLTTIIDWIAENPATSGLQIGLFGGRTGAAAAMMAAALRPANVYAVVSRGGRPDLADELLQHVHAPTLMIVGSGDLAHLDFNRQAGARMHDKPMLEVIQGASHLFGEPGKLEQVASISYQWFQRNLAMCG
jgi:putative phosphoribosyl transferase